MLFPTFIQYHFFNSTQPIVNDNLQIEYDGKQDHVSKIDQSSTQLIRGSALNPGLAAISVSNQNTQSVPITLTVWFILSVLTGCERFSFENYIHFVITCSVGDQTSSLKQ